MSGSLQVRLDPRFKEVNQSVTAFFVSPPPVFCFVFIFIFFFDIDFLLKLDIHMVLTWWPVTLGLPHFELEKKRESLSHQP